jgi:AcrR family transcriptional regulator
VKNESETQGRSDARRNREAVLEAAIAVLSERPDAPMSEIAAASGVGRTTVYRHFPTREDLVFGLFARVAEEAQAATDALVAQGLPPGELLCAVGRMAVEEIGRRYRFLDAHRALRDQALAAPAAVHSDQPMIDYLTAAQERKEIRDDLPVPWLLATMRGVITVAVDESVAGRMSVDEASKYVGDTLVAAFGAEPPAD